MQKENRMNVFSSRRGKLLTGGIAVVVLAGAGGAFAASELISPSAGQTAIIADAAGQLGVQPSALSGALTKAIQNELNAEVRSGQISQAQASALEAPLAAGQLPLVGGFGRSGGGFGGQIGGGGDLTAASTYLNLTTAQIMTDLQGGKTLAQIADATSGKSADGLIQVLVDAEKAKLAAAVTAGTLSAAQEASIEANLQTQTTNSVNGVRPAGGFGGGFRRGFGDGGPGMFGSGGGGPVHTAPF